MMGLGFKELSIILVILALLVFPLVLIARICTKAGFSSSFSGWFAVLSVLPLVNLILLWIFAFIPWPNENR